MSSKLKDNRTPKSPQAEPAQITKGPQTSIVEQSEPARLVDPKSGAIVPQEEV